ncbi:MAG: AsmA family protein [Gammaproteobacteria bacterium]|nr:AsmA family protein [Gammaproteobacteria bacterium]
MSDDIVKRRHTALRRTLKWSGITIGTLVVLIIIAIIVIPHVINTAAVKNKIEAVASEQTGRQVTIAGPLSLSLFPWIGFDANDVTMANAKGFGERPFLHVNELQIHAKLIPLIFGSVEVSGITLDSPTLHLARKENGRSNWQDLTGGGASRPENSEQESGGSPLSQLSIGHVEINDATLTYDDAQRGKHYEIRQFGLEASNLAAGRRFPLSFSTRIASEDPHFRAAIKFDTEASFDATGNRIALTQGTLDATITSYGGTQPIDLGAQWDKIAFDNAAGTATVAGLLLNVSDLKAKLDAKANQLNAKPKISGHLKVPPFSPRKVLADLGNPVPASLEGFDKASLSADLAARQNALSLVNLVLKLDDSTLRGSAGIPDLDKAGLRFDLALDHIDLSDYIVSGAGENTRLGTGHGKLFMKTRLPGRLLEGLDVAGNLAIGKLSGFGLEARDIDLGLHAEKGTVRLKPINAKLYSGTYQGQVTLSRAGRGIRLETAETLDSIELAGLIEALTGNKRLSGTANLALNLSGQGETVGELLSLLDGEVSFSIKNGALQGIDLWDSLHRAYVLFKEHKRLPAGDDPKVTKITNLEAHADIKQGKFINDKLTARLPFLAVTGHGSIDFFKTNGVDYHLLATVVETPKVSGENLSQLKSAEIPIRITGSLSDLSVYPDIEGALKERVKSEVKEKLEEKKKDLKSKLLEGLLGGKDKNKKKGGKDGNGG